MRNQVLSLLLSLFVLQIINQHSFALNQIDSDEYKVFKNIFKNYSTSIRPVKNWNDTLNIKITVSLIKVADVIEDYHSMILHVKLTLSWVDEYLTWNPSDYNNLKSIIVPSSNIWMPDMHLINSASADDRISATHAEIYSNGTIITFPLTYLNAHCDYDFARFPYDTQSCVFFIGNMADKSKVSLQLVTTVDPRKILPNTEWIYTKFEASQANDGMEMYLNNWSSAKFLMQIKRNSAFYVNLFIWPLIFILFLTMCLFILPPTCVERITLGVLILLSLIVMLLMLESYTPKNSFTAMPVIGKLIMFNMFMVTISTLVSTLIIGINRDNFIVRAIPKWLKNSTIRWFSRIACKSETVYATFVSAQGQREEEIEVLDTNQVTQQQLQNQQQQPQSESTLQASNEQTQIQTLLVLISNQLAMFRMRLQEKDLKEVNRKEWFLIASVFDRICLIIFTIIMAIGLIVVFA